MELLCLIFTFIMSRIVVKYSWSNFITSFLADILIQLLHIITFIILIFALLSSESILYRFTALYPSYQLVCCIIELFLDICYAFGFYEDSDDESDEENNNSENIEENNNSKREKRFR